MRIGKWQVCAYCYATGYAPVHGEGNPCPLKLAESEAYIGMLEAQAAAAQGSAFMAADGTAMMKKMLGIEDDQA